MINRRTLCLSAMLGGAVYSPATRAAADAWPSKPLRVVVPYPPGPTGTDAVSRQVAQYLAGRLQQPVIVENRTGANGNVGTDFVAKAPPDGYTLLAATPGPVAVGRSLYKNLPYDPLKDLAPVALINTSPVVWLSHPRLAVNSAEELIAWIKKNPGKLNASIAALGSINHLVTELLKSEARIDFRSIPYKGGAQALTDAIGGQVDMICIWMSSITGPVAAKQLRPLAIAAPSRSRLLPNVPTMAELGLPGVVGSQWNGIAAPAGTPRAIVDRLNAEVQGFLAQQDVKEKFEALGMTLAGGSADAFTAFVRTESERWARIIAQAGITEET